MVGWIEKALQSSKSSKIELGWKEFELSWAELWVELNRIELRVLTFGEKIHTHIVCMRTWKKNVKITKSCKGVWVNEYVCLRLIMYVHILYGTMYYVPYYTCELCVCVCASVSIAFISYIVYFLSLSVCVSFILNSLPHSFISLSISLHFLCVCVDFFLSISERE